MTVLTQPSAAPHTHVCTLASVYMDTKLVATIATITLSASPGAATQTCAVISSIVTSHA